MTDSTDLIARLEAWDIPDADKALIAAELRRLNARVAELEGALAKQTSDNERVLHSRVGHSMTESSWHVHLAGFPSRGDAIAALAALKGATP